MNMLRKGQMHGVEKGNILGLISFIASLFGLVASAQQIRELHVHRLSSGVFATQPLFVPEASILGVAKSRSRKLEEGRRGDYRFSSRVAGILPSFQLP